MTPHFRQSHFRRSSGGLVAIQASVVVPKTVSPKERQKRVEAAKKAWETIRKKQKRSAAAKKAWETRRKAKKQRYRSIDDI